MDELNKIYDCVVLGNEPAGLWLLKEYVRLASLETTLKPAPPNLPPKKAPSLHWLKLGTPIAPTAVPLPVARNFDLDTAISFHAEVASQHAVVSWEPATIKTRFPELPENFENRFLADLSFPNLREMSALRATLSRHPELLTYANALWKCVGRSREATAEQIVWAALMSFKFIWWQPEKGLEDIPEISTSILSTLDTLESWNRQKDGSYTLKFQNGFSISAHRVVLNLPLRMLNRLSQTNRALVNSLYDLDGVLSSICHYPMTITAPAEAVPKNLRPFTILLANEEIPEPDREINLIRCNRTKEKVSLEVWASDRYDFSLEGITDKLKDAYFKVQKTFPSLSHQTRSLSVPLGIDTCFSTPQRAELIRLIEEQGTELYDLTVLHPHTREKRVHALCPFLNCILPYPLGTLLGAKEILVEAFGKKLTHMTPAQTQPQVST